MSNPPQDTPSRSEALQPYHADLTTDALWVLNELSNINKHRRLLLTRLDCDFAHADRVTAAMRRDVQAMPLSPEGEVHADGEIVAFIAFKEDVAKGAEVSNVLNTIAHYISEVIIPRFEARFN